jgi:hypothetical protein
MSEREKYFASKVNKMLCDARATPEIVSGGIIRSYISPPYVKPDVVQVGCAVTGMIKSI